MDAGTFTWCRRFELYASGKVEVCLLCILPFPLMAHGIVVSCAGVTTRRSSNYMLRSWKRPGLRLGGFYDMSGTSRKRASCFTAQVRSFQFSFAFFKSTICLNTSRERSNRPDGCYSFVGKCCLFASLVPVEIQKLSLTVAHWAAIMTPVIAISTWV